MKTSIDDIAYAAKISKGVIYYYFSSKDEILYFILNNYIDLFLKDLEQELKEIEGSFSKIKFIISRHIGYYVKNLPECKTLLHELHCLPLKYYYKVIVGKEIKYYKIVAGLLSDFLGEHIQKDKLTAN